MERLNLEECYWDTIDPLSRQEERELIRRYQEDGDMEARETVVKANLVVTVTQRLDRGYLVVSTTRLPLKKGVTSSTKGGALILTKDSRSTRPLRGQGDLARAVGFTKTTLSFVHDREGEQVGFQFDLEWDTAVTSTGTVGEPLDLTVYGGTLTGTSDWTTLGTRRARTVGLGNGYQWALPSLLQVKIGPKEQAATVRAIASCPQRISVTRFKPELSSKKTARR